MLLKRVQIRLQDKEVSGQFFDLFQKQGLHLVEVIAVLDHRCLGRDAGKMMVRFDVVVQCIEGKQVIVFGKHMVGPLVDFLDEYLGGQDAPIDGQGIVVHVVDGVDADLSFQGDLGRLQVHLRWAVDDQARFVAVFEVSRLGADSDGAVGIQQERALPVGDGASPWTLVLCRLELQRIVVELDGVGRSLAIPDFPVVGSVDIVVESGVVSCVYPYFLLTGFP